jgi:hypothetical protein
MPVRLKVKLDPNHQNGHKDSINVVSPSQKDFDYFYERWADIRIPEYGNKRHRVLHCNLIKKYAKINRICLFLDGDYTGREKSIRTFILARYKKEKIKYWKLDPYGSDDDYRKLLRELYLYFVKKPRRNRKRKKREELSGRINNVKRMSIRRWKHYWRWILENKWRVFENDDTRPPITWKKRDKEFRRDE